LRPSGVVTNGLLVLADLGARVFLDQIRSGIQRVLALRTPDRLRSEQMQGEGLDAVKFLRNVLAQDSEPDLVALRERLERLADSTHSGCSQDMVRQLNFEPLNSEQMIDQAARVISSSAKATSNGTPLCTSHRHSLIGVAVAIFLPRAGQPPASRRQNAPAGHSRGPRAPDHPAAGSEPRPRSS